MATQYLHMADDSLWLEIAAALGPDAYDATLFSAGLGAAAIDGPLPFGDVVLVGAALSYAGRKSGKVSRILYREASDAMAAFRTYVTTISKKTGKVEVNPPKNMQHGLKKSMYQSTFDADGLQLLRRKLPVRIPIPKANKVLDFLMDKKIMGDGVSCDLVGGRIVENTVNAGLLASRGDFPREVLDAMQEIASMMYKAGVQQVPAFRKHQGKRQKVTFRWESPEGKKKSVGIGSGTHERHIDEGEGVLTTSYTRGAIGAPSTQVRIVGDGSVVNGMDRDFPGGYMAARDRQVVAMSGNKAHRSPDKLDEGTNRLFIRIAFDL